MTIIKIESTGYYNGHNNQTTDTDTKVPDGWAILPKEIGTPDTIENYPFGLIEVDNSKDPKVITKCGPPTEMPRKSSYLNQTRSSWSRQLIAFNL